MSVADKFEVQEEEGTERGNSTRRPEPPSPPESKRQRVNMKIHLVYDSFGLCFIWFVFT